MPTQFNRYDGIQVSGLEYSITRIEIDDEDRTWGVYPGEGGKVMKLRLKAKNISNDPLSELRAKSFSLQDSEGRRFSPYYGAPAFKDNLGWIQPGLMTGTTRLLVFALPFDPDLRYTLTLKDVAVDLGDPKDFDYGIFTLVDIAMQSKDVGKCNWMNEANLCYGIYARKTNDPSTCVKAPDAVSCLGSLFKSMGIDVCNVLGGEKFDVCQTSYRAWESR